MARAVWKPRPDFQTSATAWLTAGAAHHTVLTTAATAEMFEDFARIVDTELLLIDGDTTVRGFEHQVRWNNVLPVGPGLLEPFAPLVSAALLAYERVRLSFARRRRVAVAVAGFVGRNAWHRWGRPVPLGPVGLGGVASLLDHRALLYLATAATPVDHRS